MAGKGSKRRPTLVSDEQVTNNWNRIFGSKKKEQKQPGSREKAHKEQ